MLPHQVKIDTSSHDAAPASFNSRVYSWLYDRELRSSDWDVETFKKVSIFSFADANLAVEFKLLFG